MARTYEDRIRRVLLHIFDNPAGDLSLDALADIAAMSRFHWHRVFHAMTGETLADAVRRIRLHRAAALLTETDGQIAGIANEVGYLSVQSFTRAFGEHFGATPAQFRNRNRFELMLNAGGEGAAKPFEVTVTDQPQKRLLAIQHRGAYSEIGKAFETITTHFTANNRWPEARGLVGLYYDDPAAVATADLKSYAAMAVGDEAASAPGMEDMTLPAGKSAVLRITGPYAETKLAYHYLYGTWLPNSGEEPRDGPVVEHYLNAPATTPAAKLETEICIMLE